MGATDRFLDAATASAIRTAKSELAQLSPFAAVGRPVSVTFVAANTRREVAHQLGEVPDGYLVIEADCTISREPGEQWTKDLAFVRGSAANTRATLVFFVLREAPINV